MVIPDATEIPEVTVVIPSHNRLGYLKDALASVAAQRRPVARVIVVDDGSSDGTAEWLAGEWLAGPGGAAGRVLRQEPARGGSAARNAGLAGCDTPFVLFLDDDDVLRPGAIAALAAALAAARPDVAGAAGKYCRFGALSEVARDLHPRFGVTVTVWREELFGWNMPPGALLWRTEVVRRIGGWDSSLPRCEDRDLNLRAYPRRFVLVPDAVLDYRVHEGQQPGSAQVDIDRSVLARFIESLPSGDRRTAEAIIDARRHLDEGLERYTAGDFRAAVPHLLSVLRRAPTLGTSPVLGPWLIGLVAKAGVGAAIPRLAAAAVQGAVRRRRPAAPASPEQDPMA